MACRVKDNKIDSVIKFISEQGFDGLWEAVTFLINHAMDIERSHHLQATPYERTKSRSRYANGYKAKKVKCRVGELDLRVP